MSTTTNLALNEPAYNSTSPTWDQPLNYNATILDQMFGNTTSISVSTSGSPTYTNITAPSSTAAGNTSQCMRFNLTGSLAANQTVLLPQSVAGMWIATNSTTGTYTVSIGSNNGSNVAAGTVLSVPQGYSTLIYSDGTNVKVANDIVLSSATNLTLSGNLSVGGTSTFTGAITASSATLSSNLSVGGATSFTGAVTASSATLSNNLTINGTSTFTGAATSTIAAILQNAAEVSTVTVASATGTINFNVLTQSVLFYTLSAASNFTINIRGDGSNTLNSIMTTGQSVTIAFLNTNGASAYYNSAVTIDGASVTPQWQGGTAPSAGNASSLDVYVYTIIKTASATYTVLASLTQFK